MEHHPTWVGDIFHFLFGGIVGPLLEMFGIHPHDAARPIPDHIAIELFIFLLCIPFFLWFRRKLSADNPGGLQLAFEQLLNNDFKVGIYDLLDEIVGHGGRKHLPVIGSIGLFVLFCNSISLIPDTLSPTAVHTVPLGCAIAVFLYYHLAGIETLGLLAYGKHFLGPILVMSPLMVIIEVFSHLGRILSLTVRLFANMTVSEMLYVQFLKLSLMLTFGLLALSSLSAKGFGLLSVAIPLAVPPVFVVLHVFVAVVQAFVFTLLPIVYVGGAVEKEH